MRDISLYHLDTDYLVVALTESGLERRRLLDLAQSQATEIQISGMAWYEFCRGPRTPQQIAVARTFLSADGVVPITEAIAYRAAEVFRMLGSPRTRAGDIVIGVTASLARATLLTCNQRDFAGIPDLRLEP